MFVSAGINALTFPKFPYMLVRQSERSRIPPENGQHTNILFNMSKSYCYNAIQL